MWWMTILLVGALQDAPPDEMLDRSEPAPDIETDTPAEAGADPVADPAGPASADAALPALCIPGEARACACTDGRQGAQTCQEDGRGLSQCICAPEAANPSLRSDAPPPPTDEKPATEGDTPAAPLDPEAEERSPPTDADLAEEDGLGRGAATVVASALLPGLGQFLLGEWVSGGVHLALGLGTALAVVAFGVLPIVALGTAAVLIERAFAAPGQQSGEEFRRTLLLADIAFYVGAGGLLVLPLGVVATVAQGTNWVWSMVDASPLLAGVE